MGHPLPVGRGEQSQGGAGLLFDRRHRRLRVWAKPLAERIVEAPEGDLDEVLAQACARMERCEDTGQRLIGTAVLERIGRLAAERLGLDVLDADDALRTSLARRIANRMLRDKPSSAWDLLGETVVWAGSAEGAPEPLRVRAEEVSFGELTRGSPLSLGIARTFASADENQELHEFAPLCRRLVDRAFSHRSDGADASSVCEAYRESLELKTLAEPAPEKTIRAICAGTLSSPSFRQEPDHAYEAAWIRQWFMYGLAFAAIDQLCCERGGVAAAARWLISRARPELSATEITRLAKRADRAALAGALHADDEIDPRKIGSRLAKFLSGASSP